MSAVRGTGREKWLVRKRNGYWFIWRPYQLGLPGWQFDTFPYGWRPEDGIYI